MGGRANQESADDRVGPDLTDASRGERLQRVMADAGVASRRRCEQLIGAGHVEVNGRTVTELPLWVDPAVDTIVVDGRPLPKAERHVYVLLNKPARTLTTSEDEPGADRRTVLDLVDHPASSRLFPVGRLDFDTVGLLLLTNDGKLANRLTHPRYGVPKTYRAKVKGIVDPEATQELERGIYLAERKAGRTVGAARTSAVELSVVRRDRDATILDITLREGRNRQVRRMLAAVGFPVKKLERVAMGPLRLKGVARGGWRELTAGELAALRRAASDQRRPGPASRQGRRSASGGGSKPTSGRTPPPKSPKKPKKPSDRDAQGPAAPDAPKRLGKRVIKDAVHRATPERSRRDRRR